MNEQKTDQIPKHEYNVNDIVCIVADCPSGAEEYFTKGKIGRISKREYIESENDWDYWVSYETDEWVFSEDEIRLATNSEIKEKLLELLVLFGRRYTSDNS